MDFSFSLIDPLTDEEQRTFNVGICLYSLQSYVYEHWLDHLLASTPEVGTSDPLDQDLVAQLQRLVFSMKTTCTTLENTANEFSLEEQDSMSKVEARVSHFRNHREIYGFLRRMVRHRQLKRLYFGEEPESSRSHHTLI